MQGKRNHIIVSSRVKAELERRKVALSRRCGGECSFNDVLINMLRT